MATFAQIAHIKSDFKSKFGIPRQSGVVQEAEAAVVFEPPYRSREAVRGLEDFSHIWLIWGFSGVQRGKWQPTVRPPRLGGNARMGVFATRSPYRPNPIGLSCVKLGDILPGPALQVWGADLMDGTPIYDIKPYLPFADCIPGATGGFAATAPQPLLHVVVQAQWPARLPLQKRRALCQILAQDPRPAYQNQEGRVYGLEFAGYEVKFTVRGNTLTVCSMEKV